MLKLGTDRHHGKFLDDIDRAKEIGCFGLTELGFGQYSTLTRQFRDQDSPFIRNGEFIILLSIVLTRWYLIGLMIVDFIV